MRCKRLLRLVPAAAALMLVLALSLALLAGGFVSDNESRTTTKYRLAVCGDLDDTVLQLGFSALQTFDESRFALEITQMPLEQAKKALDNREIAAYIVFPEGFSRDAQRGVLQTLEFVTYPDAQGMTLLLKTELAGMAGDILLSAQRSVFGAAELMEQNGFEDKVSWYLNDFAVEYGTLAFLRGNMTKTENLGIGGADSLQNYLICGLSVVFLCLCCLSFAPVMIPQNTAFSRMLRARGFSGGKQGFLDFGAEALGLAVLTAAVAALPGIAAACRGVSLPVSLLLGALPVIVTVAALSFFFYSLSGDLIGGVLLQFLGMVCLSFLSGCMYPGFFFPTAVQKLGDWLPMGLCRRWLMSCLSENADVSLLLAMGGVALAAAAGGTALRQRRIRAAEGVGQ